MSRNIFQKEIFWVQSSVSEKQLDIQLENYKLRTVSFTIKIQTILPARQAALVI